MEFITRFFKLQENKTNIRTEIIAGITTFMTMAYILFLNPNILSATGMDKNAVFFATVIAAGFVTIAMGLVANFPIALAPGMGLNAFFATVALVGVGMPWRVALGAVFISGLIFILLTITKVRQILVVAVPHSLKVAITVGIGLFITLHTSGKVYLQCDHQSRMNYLKLHGLVGCKRIVQREFVNR